MNAGRLNRRITIQSRPMGQDSYGQETGSWTNFATLWADVEPITGNEFFTAAAVGSEINRRIVTRYHAGISASQRILLGDEVLDIEAVMPDRRKTQLEILCKQAG